MIQRAKHASYFTTAVGLLVLIAAGYAFKDKALEQWYLWKLKSEDYEERWAAAEALEELNHEAAEDWYIKTLGSQDERQRRRACAKLLFEMNSLKAVPKLMDLGVLLRDSDSGVRHATVQALKKIQVEGSQNGHKR